MRKEGEETEQKVSRGKGKDHRKRKSGAEKKTTEELGRKVLEGLVWPVIFTVFSIYAASFVVSGIFGFLPDGAMTTMLAQAVTYGLALAIILWVSMKISHWSRAEIREELGIIGWPTWTDIGLAVVGLAVYFVLATIMTQIFLQFPWFQVNEAQDVGFSTYIYGVDRMVAFFALCVVAPVMEELIFRGFLYGKLRNSYGMVVSAVVVSLVFGYMHGQWNVGVSVAAMSLVMCGMREITGTVYSGMLLHMMKNFVAFMIVYVWQM